MSDSKPFAEGGLDDRLLADCRSVARRVLRAQTCWCGLYAADDAVHEATVKLLRQGKELEAHANPRAWMLRVVMTCAVDHLRQHGLGAKGARTVSLDDDDDWQAHVAHVVADRTLDPERLLLQHEERQFAINALSSLSNAERECALRKYVLGQSEEEIRAAFGEVKKWRVRNLLRSVRQHFRRLHQRRQPAGDRHRS